MEKLSMKEKFEKLCADAETLDTIEAHISNGGSLIDLCETWGVRYSDIVKWLNTDDKRKKLFLSALDARAEWAVQRILAELNSIAFTDITKIFDENHELLPPDKWPKSISRAVAAIDVSELFDYEDNQKIKVGNLKKVKLYDKTKAIELLGRDLGRFINRHELSGKLTLEDLVNGSLKEEQSNE